MSRCGSSQVDDQRTFDSQRKRQPQSERIAELVVQETGVDTVLLAGVTENHHIQLNALEKANAHERTKKSQRKRKCATFL
jgi:hypothetical protein